MASWKGKSCNINWSYDVFLGGLKSFLTAFKEYLLRENNFHVSQILYAGFYIIFKTTLRESLVVNSTVLPFCSKKSFQKLPFCI